MDFVLRGHDIIWVMVDRLIKFKHFLSIRLSNSIEDLGVIYVREIVILHGVPIFIVSNIDPHFTSLIWKWMQSALGLDLRLSTMSQIDGQFERIIQILEDIFRACVFDFGGS